MYAPNLERLPEIEKLRMFEKVFKLLDLRQKNGKFVLNGRCVSFIARKPADNILKIAKAHL